MKNLNDYDAKSILSEDVFKEIFDETDKIKQARMIIDLEDRAKEVGVKAKFEALIKAYQNVEKETKKINKEQNGVSLDNWTNFTGGEYDNMYCGAWIATDRGIYAQNFQSATDIVACYHPILPVERLKNLETGEEQLVIAYKRNNTWNTIKVSKDVVSSASKIVALSKYGISVTSENAKYLVKYLSDVENFNDEYIKVQSSTAKLGWIKNDFIPYGGSIIFDGDNRFRSLYEAVHSRGSEEVWLKHMKELRRTGRKEIKFMLAASFSSVLIEILGGLPYFVDLWGETEGGKSVSLMVACSVWANPDESQYIGDFKTTDVALEAKADMLNNLPMMLDDTSKTSARIRDNFEGVVYDLCSGKGKSRSNKELGINRENRWKNCIITNGERPLQSYVSQGGAINRILEIECGREVYKDPGYTAEIIKRNYGFAGKRFVQIVKSMELDDIKQIQKSFQEQFYDNTKMQKQVASLSIIMTADKLATDYIFKDSCYLTVEEAKEALTDKNMLSDNERCYRFLCDKVAMNAQRFDGDTKIEKWGIIEHGYAIFYTQAFDELCKSGGYSKKSFLSWADRNGLLQTQGSNFTKVKKINGSAYRCVILQLQDIESREFLPVENSDLPF